MNRLSIGATVTSAMLGAVVLISLSPQSAKPCHGANCPTPSPSSSASPTLTASITPSPTPTQATPTPTSAAGQTTLLMLVNWADDVRQPWTPEFFRDVWSGAPPSVDDWWNQASGGTVTMATTVVGWWVLPNTTVTTCSISALSVAADAFAVAQGIDPNAYDHRVYLWPLASACHFAGTADWPGKRSWQNLEVPNCTVANRCGQDFHSFVHEMGHNFGLDHAGSWICTDPVDGPHVVLSNTCTQQDYGDPFDIMGCCETSVFSNIHRLQLGWQVGPLVDVTQTTTLNIGTTRGTSTPVYRVPDGTGQYLYLENRGAGGTIYDLGGSTPWANGNLLVRRYGPIALGPNGNFAGVTQLLDGSPGDNNTIPNAKSLPIGASFTLPNAPVTIANQSWAGGANTVLVTYN